MSRTSTYLQLPEQAAESVESFLGARFRLLVEPPTSRRVDLYDTFDWRLYKAGTLLRVAPSKPGFQLTWCTLGGDVTGQTRQTQQTRQGSTPGLLASIDDLELRRQLAPLIAMRRMLPMAETTYRARTLRILNRDDKTVARVRVHKGQGRVPKSGDAPRPLPVVLQLVGVRGYTKAMQRVETALRDDFGCLPVVDNEVQRTLTAIGSPRTPGDYSSKPSLVLDPTTPSTLATQQILQALLQAMQRNEDGLRRDLDSEFLHDFRVAVRRTRSALSQIKKVFAPQSLAHFRDEFAWLGRLTGPTRDLDVYLLKMEGYRRDLPSEVAQHLDPLTAFLAKKQRQEHRRLVSGLNAKRYRELLTRWDAFLDEPVPSSQLAPNGKRPIVELASQRIWRLYRRVLKDGHKILRMVSQPEAHAEALHDLRIVCKKLRYGMEFFRSLYPESEVLRLIRALKKLQDNLGDFNDYEVQRDQLARFAEEMLAHDSTQAATLLAMGSLMTQLNDSQEQERLAFEMRFRRFADDSRRRQFEKLFKPG